MKRHSPSVPPSVHANVRKNQLVDNQIREILSLPELAERLQLSVSGLYKLVRRRKIPFLKVGRQYRFQWSVVVGHLSSGGKDGL